MLHKSIQSNQIWIQFQAIHSSLEIFDLDNRFDILNPELTLIVDMEYTFLKQPLLKSILRDQIHFFYLN